MILKTHENTNAWLFAINDDLFNKIKIIILFIGGERGIRTLESLSALHALQACALDHYATSPSKLE